MKSCYGIVKKFSLFLAQPYMGHTGYSTKENVNNIEITHLHWGLQLIFDESQKEGNNEIWIDVYPLTRFLAKHTQAAVKVGGRKSGCGRWILWIQRWRSMRRRLQGRLEHQ